MGVFCSLWRLGWRKYTGRSASRKVVWISLAYGSLRSFIPCIPFFLWKAYWNILPCRERTSCLKEFAPIVSVFFFYVCEGVVEDIDHVLVKCTVANQVWMVGLPELFELELWTLRGIGCLPYWEYLTFSLHQTDRQIGNPIERLWLPYYQQAPTGDELLPTSSFGL